MSVIDASIVVDAVAVSGPAGDAARVVLATERVLDVPAILPAEATSALRSMARRRELAPDAARHAMIRVLSLRTRLHAFAPYARRVWELRDSVTVYDAWYVAVAESLGMGLVTADEGLARASGVRCPISTPRV